MKNLLLAVILVLALSGAIFADDGGIPIGGFTSPAEPCSTQKAVVADTSKSVFDDMFSSILIFIKTGRL